MSSIVDKLLARWTRTAREPVSWESRNTIVAALIPAGHRVLDLGAGNRNLQSKLPADCTYVPCDRVQALEGTILCDFNQDIYPDFAYRFDTVVLSGVLEYIHDPEHLLSQLHRYGDRVIITYAFASDQPDYKKRANNDWVTHFTRAQFEHAMLQSGWSFRFVTYWERQGIYVLAPTGLHRETPPIVNLHRLDAGNIGDYYCSPSLYFPLGDVRSDVRHCIPTRWHSNIIVGGGGLLSPTFYPQLRTLRTTRSLIYWGVGENNVIDVARGYQEYAPVHVPDDIQSGATLIGLRDYTPDFPWAPCASCMHPLFEITPVRRHEVGFYTHKRVPLDAGHHPALCNDRMSLFEALSFLASCDTVVTNSYHGVYWATLLGCRVICIPFGSKFYHFKHPPVFSSPNDWREQLARARPYPNALQECRQATRAFHERCLRALR